MRNVQTLVAFGLCSCPFFVGNKRVTHWFSGVKCRRPYLALALRSLLGHTRKHFIHNLLSLKGLEARRYLHRLNFLLHLLLHGREGTEVRQQLIASEDLQQTGRRAQEAGHKLNAFREALPTRMHAYVPRTEENVFVQNIMPTHDHSWQH